MKKQPEPHRDLVGAQYNKPPLASANVPQPLPAKPLVQQNNQELWHGQGGKPDDRVVNVPAHTRRMPGTSK